MSGRLADPAGIQEEVQRVLSDPMYDWQEARGYRFSFEWLEAIGDWLGSLFDLGGVPQGVQPLLLVLALALMFVLVAKLAYTLMNVFAAPPRTAPVIKHVGPPPPGKLAEEAAKLAQEGNYVDASRRLYEACLIMLEERRKGRVRRGLTASEYIRTFKSDWVRDNLGVFARLITFKWYGGKTFDRSDYEACRQAYDSISVRLAREPQ